MLKRNDLVKQFELVVKQEIANHNSQILATNLSINNLKSILDSQRKAQEKDSSFLGESIQKVNKQLLEFIKLYECFYRESADIVRKQNEINTHVDFEINHSIDEISSFNQKCEHLQSKFVRLHEKVISLCDSIDSLNKDKNKIVCDLESKICKEISKCKQEILSIPSEAQLVKKELEEKIKISRIDFEGVMKELSVVKRDNFVLKKEIENLYTQLERIKAK